MTKFRKSLKVNGITVNRCVINLEITCVNNNSLRCIYCKSRSINDAVVGTDELDPEITEIYILSIAYHLAFNIADQVVLFAVVVGISALASLIGIRKALRTDVGEVLS